MDSGLPHYLQAVLELYVEGYPPKLIGTKLMPRRRVTTVRTFIERIKDYFKEYPEKYPEIVNNDLSPSSALILVGQRYLQLTNTTPSCILKNCPYFLRGDVA